MYIIEDPMYICIIKTMLTLRITELILLTYKPTVGSTVHNHGPGVGIRSWTRNGYPVEDQDQDRGPTPW